MIACNDRQTALSPHSLSQSTVARLADPAQQHDGGMHDTFGQALVHSLTEHFEAYLSPLVQLGAFILQRKLKAPWDNFRESLTGGLNQQQG